MDFWIDTHAHLDAPEFGASALAVIAQAATKNVAHCVIPAVSTTNWSAVRTLAHQGGCSYALGIHPLQVPNAQDSDLDALAAQLLAAQADTRLVAVGEIGLDFFVPALCTDAMRDRQERFYRAQLVLAQRMGLPVVLHVRQSADRLLKHLRALRFGHGGIAHAFNGSRVQAQAFIDLGFKLGFGGAVTFERALHLRRLATELPLAAIVLETDAPDMPPQWLYKTAQQRAVGAMQGCNSPAELPRIAAMVAQLRGISTEALAQATTANVFQVLPRLAALLADGPPVV
jgi:TatD DNase family protein